MNILEPVAILGAGMMGAAIAAVHLRCEIPVVLYDSSDSMLETAAPRIAEELRLQNCPFDGTLLETATEIGGVFSCSILIETITEKIKAKQKLYRTLLPGLTSEALLFSNTSTISIAKLAEGLPPERRKNFCGFHVFHPVRENSLLEIIPGVETVPETVGAARYHARRIDKRPIVVGDGPGFLVNRILNPYLTEALKLFESGMDMRRIERIATNFGMRMGPFRIMDEIGLDVVLHAGWVLFKAFPERVLESSLLLKLVEQGRLGRKTGRGFMIYPNQNPWDGDGRPDPELIFPSSISNVSDEEIENRLFLSMYDEALRCRDDGVITSLADADLASTRALGFPLEKGGIVQWGQIRRK